jgi:hypothetical protein
MKRKAVRGGPVGLKATQRSLGEGIRVSWGSVRPIADELDVAYSGVVCTIS